MVCRGLMLKLHRAGLIELPPVRQTPPNNVVARRKPQRVLIDRTPLCTSLKQIRPLEILQVRRTREETFYDGLIEEHHYLGYTRPVGEHLKYLIVASDRPVACMAWGSAPRHLGPRDRFIGWSARGPSSQHPLCGLQHPLPDPSLGGGAASGVAPSGSHGAGAFGGLGAGLQPPDLLPRDVRGSERVSEAPATSRPTGLPWVRPQASAITRRRTRRPSRRRKCWATRCGKNFASCLRPMSQRKPELIELDAAELGAIVERTKAALDAEDYEKLKATVETFLWMTAELEKKNATLARLRKELSINTKKTEKTSEVLKGAGWRRAAAR